MTTAPTQRTLHNLTIVVDTNDTNQSTRTTRPQAPIRTDHQGDKQPHKRMNYDPVPFSSFPSCFLSPPGSPSTESPPLPPSPESIPGRQAYRIIRRPATPISATMTMLSSLSTRSQNYIRKLPAVTLLITVLCVVLYVVGVMGVPVGVWFSLDPGRMGRSQRTWVNWVSWGVWWR